MKERVVSNFERQRNDFLSPRLQKEAQDFNNFVGISGWATIRGGGGGVGEVEEGDHKSSEGFQMQKSDSEIENVK